MIIETIDLTSDAPMGQRSEIIDVDSLPDRSVVPRAVARRHLSGTPTPQHIPHFQLPTDLEEFLVGGGIYQGRRDYNFANGRVQQQQQQHHHHHHRHQHLRHHHHHHLHATIFTPPQLDYTLAAAFGNFVETEEAPPAQLLDANYRAPPPPRKGFTRSPTAKDKLICPQCEGTLHHDPEGRIFASRCGHVYCQACTVKRKAGKTALCAVKGCKRITPRSLIEIYL